MSGSYEFVFFTTDSHAIYSFGTLQEAKHFADEAVDYDYLLTEQIVAGESSGPATGEPGASVYVASGGSEYQFGLGDQTSNTPAVYDPSASSPYVAPISHTEVTRIENWADGSGSTVGANGSDAPTSDSRDGIGVRTTYVETVTKTGNFLDASQATGTITVSIDEVREETTESTTVVTPDPQQERQEQSSETTRRTERASRQYSGKATYTTGVSTRGFASLVETRDVRVTVNGSGTSRIDLRRESWDYGGASEFSSVLVVGGSWFESLDPASPGEHSDVSGRYDAESSVEWSARGETKNLLPSGGTGDRDEVQTESELTTSTTLAETFRVTTDDGLRRATGDSETEAESRIVERTRGEFREGLVNYLPPFHPLTGGAAGDYSSGDFQTRTVGTAEARATTEYVTVRAPDGTGGHRETTDFDVASTGSSRSASHVGGWVSDDGITRYTLRDAAYANISFSNDGVVTEGWGEIDGESVVASRAGLARSKSTSGAKSSQSVSGEEGRLVTIQSTDEALSQLYTYSDDQQDGVTKRSVSRDSTTIRNGGISTSSSNNTASSSYSTNAQGRSSDGASEGSSSSSGSNRSSYQSATPGGKSWGSTSSKSSTSGKGSSTYSTNSDGDTDSSSNSSGKQSTSVKSSGGSQSSGGGASSGSSGSTRATERSGGSSSTNNTASDSSGKAK
ncbi:MAG: hypothetical protein AAGG08_15495, partial [Actinomycetota bacterium]